jgi:hypothetical protein
MFSDLPMANMNTGDKTKRKLAEILKETKAWYNEDVSIEQTGFVAGFQA